MVVATSDRVRLSQVLREAEGYLELHLPHRALETLARLPRLSQSSTHGLYLQGEALRELERYEDAISPLQKAAKQDPENIHVHLALGWCFKRTEQLDLAIHALEQALDSDPAEALVLYNLACYWSLNRNKQKALDFLSRALRLDGKYRDLIGEESDFDPIRSDSDFQALTSIIV